MAVAGAAGAVTKMGAGLAAWSVTEYVFHRWVLHGPVAKTPIAAEHRAHHREPMATDPGMRAAGIAGVGAVAIVGARVVPGPTAFSWWLGYVAYDQLHWRSHHRRPRSRFERHLVRRHRLHHRRGGNFGVTLGWMDRLLRSEQDPHRSERAQTQTVSTKMTEIATEPKAAHRS